MRRYHNIDKINSLIGMNNIKIMKQSKNTRISNKDRAKYGIKVPNNVRRALKIDDENKDNLSAEAIIKATSA